MKNGQKTVALLFATMLLTACASSGTSPDSVAAAEDATPKKYNDPALYNTSVTDPDEVTCRQVKKNGSRLTEEVCKTNRQWGMGHRGGRNMAEDIQRKSALVQTIGGG